MRKPKCSSKLLLGRNHPSLKNCPHLGECDSWAKKVIAKHEKREEAPSSPFIPVLATLAAAAVLKTAQVVDRLLVDRDRWRDRARNYSAEIEALQSRCANAEREVEWMRKDPLRRPPDGSLAYHFKRFGLGN